MERFYELRGGATLNPVPQEALRARDDEWLRERVAKAETTAPAGLPASLGLSVQGLSCVACVWLLEKVFRSMPGAVQLDVHVARGEVYLEWRSGEFDVPGFVARMQQFGYLAGPLEEVSRNAVQSASFGRRVGLCGAFAMNAMAFSLPAYLGMEPDFLFAGWFDIIAAGSATMALLVGGSYFIERSWQSLRRGVLHMDTPIALGVTLAWLGSMGGWMAGASALKYFDFVAVFVFLMLAGRWLQQGALERNRRRLLSSGAVPESVKEIGRSAAGEKKAVTEVVGGDLLVIPTGGVCPVESTLESSRATISLEWINGESAAVTRVTGQRLPSGSINIGTASIKVKAGEAWSDSLLCRLNATTGKEAAIAPLGRFLPVYLGLVLAAGVVGGLAWWFTGHSLVTALQVMISVFVVSCPCAIGVALPFADDLAASLMSKVGVFVRAGGLWARLRRVKKVVFDKTGTLTLENPVLANPGAITTLDATAVAALQHLVSGNLHPVSRSLFDALAALRHGVTSTLNEEVAEVVGQGVQFRDGQGRVWRLGRPGWRGQETSTLSEEADHDAELTRDGEVIAVFRFLDALRPETVKACDVLRKQGCQIFLLSGDRETKVRTVASRLQMASSHWQGDMTPAQKAARVRSINDGDTLYLGDGANDSLALEAALCGGSPVTGRHFLEHRADFYFLGNSLPFVPALMALAQRHHRAVARVIRFALVYNLAAVALSLAGRMSPLAAAVLMPLSSLVTLGLVAWTFRQGGAGHGAIPTQKQEEMEQTMRRQPGPVPI